MAMVGFTAGKPLLLTLPLPVRLWLLLLLAARLLCLLLGAGRWAVGLLPLTSTPLLLLKLLLLTLPGTCTVGLMRGKDPAGRGAA